MSDDRTVANPDRTRVDSEDDLPREQPDREEQPAEDPTVHPTGQHYEQPWPAVAREVRQAEDNG